jgi:hypothetical protein
MKYSGLIDRKLFPAHMQQNVTKVQPICSVDINRMDVLDFCILRVLVRSWDGAVGIATKS